MEILHWRNWPFSIKVAWAPSSAAKKNANDIRSEKTAKTKTKTAAKMSGPTLLPGPGPEL